MYRTVAVAILGACVLVSAFVLLSAATPASGSAADGSDAPVVSATGQCFSGLPSPSTQAASVGITVAERVETPHLAMLAGNVEQPLVSRDGKAYAIFVVRSDLAKDGQWLDILVGRLPGDGGPAEPPRCLVSLFTDARRYTEVPGAHDHLTSTGPGQLSPVWLADSRHLVFAWSSGPAATQLVSVDLATGGISQLTHSADSIYKYLITPDAKVIAYITNPSADLAANAKLYRQGFAIRSLDWRTIDQRHYDGVEPWNRTSSHLKIGDEIRDASGILSSRDSLMGGSSLSPDGRYVVTPSMQVAAPPERWLAFKNYSSGPFVYETRVFDLMADRSWPLVDAPDPNRPRRMAWSPDGTRLLIGPTRVPGAGASPAGRAGEATAVIDLPSGRLFELPIPGQYRDYTPLAWERGDNLILSKGPSRIRFAPADGGWRFAGSAPAPDIKIVQEMNRPPALVAGAAHGTPRVLLEIAPQLQSHRLGRVTPVSWTDRAGHAWRGRLYLPPDYVIGRRYPLVVQTHGIPGEAEFSLSGISDAIGTEAYAAQVLATKGIAVLQTPETVIEGVPEEPEQFMEMLTGAIERLTADRIADPKRIGLMGYSRTCWHVEYALTHSGLEIGAAVAADGMDASYISGSLLPYYKGYSADLGAPPFGAGLAAWLEHSPGFTVERIRAPLLMIGSDGVDPWGFWELLTRMRQLKLPVELFQYPEYRTADHPLQVPSQQYASQQRTVDWFDFWLNGHEDPDPAKREQYEGWRELKVQRDAAVRLPRPPLLHWTATPIPEEATREH